MVNLDRLNDLNVLLAQSEKRSRDLTKNIKELNEKDLYDFERTLVAMLDISKRATDRIKSRLKKEFELLKPTIEKL